MKRAANTLTSWLRRRMIAVRDRRLYRSDRPGFPLWREYGGWAVRPDRGWRSVRWVTPPLYYTRRFTAADDSGAADWAMEKLGIG
ncbi:hypothetical protein IU469_17840 [Nocardia puris]|uniref:hypothetical protein n=1 Tax=Nocardia puris TaxID=208602 RepID=UPI001893BA72|nr:hypothetical protein [Nocardia puris]MBF6367571.1 hypothetical protein [Nocardia puris]